MTKLYPIAMLIAACMNQVSRSLPDSMSPADIIYYRENGKEISRKIDDKINKTYVIKTTKTARDIYLNKEMQKSKNSLGPANVNFISRYDARITKKAIRRKNFDAEIVMANTVEIVNKEVLQKMSDSIKDDGNQGTDPKNNREYGGAAKNDGSVSVVEGPKTKPTDTTHPAIDIKDTGIIYHSHPSGSIGNVPTVEEEQAQELYIGSRNIVGNSAGWAAYMQGPSFQDQKKAKSIEYVFAMRTGIIYIYDNNGIVATLPLSMVRTKH